MEKFTADESVRWGYYIFKTVELGSNLGTNILFRQVYTNKLSIFLLPV